MPITNVQISENQPCYESQFASGLSTDDNSIYQVADFEYMFPEVDVFKSVKYTDGATQFTMAKPPSGRKGSSNTEHVQQFDLLKDRKNKCPNS